MKHLLSDPPARIFVEEHGGLVRSMYCVVELPVVRFPGNAEEEVLLIRAARYIAPKHCKYFTNILRAFVLKESDRLQSVWLGSTLVSLTFMDNRGPRQFDLATDPVRLLITITPPESRRTAGLSPLGVLMLRLSAAQYAGEVSVELITEIGSFCWTTFR